MKTFHSDHYCQRHLGFYFGALLEHMLLMLITCILIILIKKSVNENLDILDQFMTLLAGVEMPTVEVLDLFLIHPYKKCYLIIRRFFQNF